MNQSIDGVMGADYSEAPPLPRPAPCVLALETATAACSVAVLRDDVAFERHAIAARQHTDVLWPMIETVLAEAGIGLDAIDLIAFGRGPGTFSGVRIAAATAQGLALPRALPLAAISSLAALARGGARQHGARQVLATFDARRDQVYVGAYRFEHGLDDPLAVIADCVLAPEDVLLAQPHTWHAVGNGWTSYAARLPHALQGTAEPLHPHASDVAWLARRVHASGGCVGVADALPVYLRDALD